MKKTSLLMAALATSALAGSLPLHAEELDDLFAKGDAGLEFRYRIELVDQDGLAENATASTLLTKLWYSTANVHGFSGYLEATNVTSVGKQHYNSTVNGNTAYPVVADPEVTELNQAYAQYKNDFATVKVGRQGVNLDDQRFIGTVGWRQNDQTYDAAAAILTPAKDLTAIYGYVWNVNRIFGRDHPLGDLDTNTHLFNVTYSGFGFGRLTAYSYLLDLNDAPVLGLSSATYGARFTGSTDMSEGVKFGYQAEYARQTDYKNNPADFAADFWHLGADVSVSGVTLGLDYELLGSDGGAAFQTPLATLHKFNGWADKFLTTPGQGLQDVYASLAYTVPGEGVLSGLKLLAVYHDFKSDIGDVSYGSEWNFQASKALNKYLNLVVKAAHYNADAFATDTTKFWIMLGAKF